MQQEQHNLKELFQKIFSGAASRKEKEQVAKWLSKLDVSERELSYDEIEKQRLQLQSNFHERYGQVLPGKKQRLTSKNVRYLTGIAASVLIILAIGSYFLLHPQKTASKNTIVKHDVAPGINQATLILANGKKVILSNLSNGQLARQAGVIINKNKDGELVYEARTDTTQATPQFNTLQTARGEQYQVVLPDGSHVWLNAASSLKYPTAFTGTERVVELTGEAYFEVAHNKAKPFKVKTPQQETEVLGTHFNMNTYSDEKAITTTLIEGSVKVTGMLNHSSVVIKPGQQSVLSADGLNVREADTDEAIAWKNGYFQFNDENLESIMRKVARWYDVEVIYPQLPANLSFLGLISRTKNLSAVLQALEETGKIKFEIEGKKVTCIVKQHQ